MTVIEVPDEKKITPIFSEEIQVTLTLKSNIVFVGKLAVLK
jgi:hypothetical protein